MKNIKLLKFFTISILSTALFTTDYDNAKFDNYVSGQGVNEVLAEAQYIICAVSKKKIPLKRFATAEELDVIISMLLNRQNTYMTGAVIAVDGGLSAGL